MNILYFSSVRLYPISRGNTAVIHRYIERLRNNGHKVHYVYFDEEYTDPTSLFLAQDYVDTLDVIKKNILYEKKTPEGYYAFDSCYQHNLGEKIDGLCKLYKIDIVICSYVKHSKILEYVDKRIIKIIDTHDKMTNRHLMLKNHNIKNEFFSCSQNDEAKYLNRADIIWAMRDEERDFFNAITYSNKAITISHFDAPKFLNKKVSKIKKIGFIASDNNLNLVMVKEFISSLLSNASFLASDIDVLIAGDIKRMIGNDSKMLKDAKKSHVKFLGFVENAEDFYKQIDLAIIPVSFGTGINIKTIEPLSFGVPVLSTAFGTKGLITNNEYHNSSTVSELIDKLMEIYGNLAKIKDLTESSKNVYRKFYFNNIKKFDSCFKKK